MANVNYLKEKFVKDCLLMYLKKDKDYGNSVEKSLNRFGIVAYQVRALDKINRLVQLCSMGFETNITDEKIDDTIQDLFIYSCITKVWEIKQTSTLTFGIQLMVETLQKFLDVNTLVQYLSEHSLLDEIGVEVRVSKALKKYFNNKFDTNELTD